jgi:hypothetical protein
MTDLEGSMSGQQLGRPGGKAVIEEYGNIAIRLPHICSSHECIQIATMYPHEAYVCINRSVYIYSTIYVHIVAINDIEGCRYCDAGAQKLHKLELSYIFVHTRRKRQIESRHMCTCATLTAVRCQQAACSV